MRKNSQITTRTYNNLLERIGEILNQARAKVIREINRTQVLASKYKLTLPTEKELRAKLKPLPLLKSKSEREG